MLQVVSLGGHLVSYAGWLAGWLDVGVVQDLSNLVKAVVLGGIPSKG